MAQLTVVEFSFFCMGWDSHAGKLQKSPQPSTAEAQAEEGELARRIATMTCGPEIEASRESSLRNATQKPANARLSASSSSACKSCSCLVGNSRVQGCIVTQGSAAVWSNYATRACKSYWSKRLDVH